jgi:hypothetical protein
MLFLFVSAALPVGAAITEGGCKTSVDCLFVAVTIALGPGYVLVMFLLWKDKGGPQGQAAEGRNER